MARNCDHLGTGDRAGANREVAMLDLEFLWKDEESGQSGCPALYRTTDRTGYIVQGVKLSDDDRAQLRNLADGEDGVYVPANVLDRLRMVR